MNRKKTKFTIAGIFSLLLVVAAVLISMATSTTPLRAKQRMILGLIRNCIWYGCDDFIIFSSSDGGKEEIVLPQTLSVYKPLVTRFGFNRTDNMDASDLIFNPQGFENNTWIAIFRNKGISGTLEGDLVLWHDKQISNKHGLYKQVSQNDKFVYYTVAIR